MNVSVYCKEAAFFYCRFDVFSTRGHVSSVGVLCFVARWILQKRSGSFAPLLHDNNSTKQNAESGVSFCFHIQGSTGHVGTLAMNKMRHKKQAAGGL